ncbi:MAG: hypothetical protein K2Q03_08505, partial [Sphingobacteriaceae bacterium]|nr:hypothetical protein [Sphingobacteriaceae bacterium]
EYNSNVKRTVRGLKEGSLNISKLAKTKSSEWKFQSEWRFIIYQFPDKEMLHKLLNNNLSEVKDILEKYEFKHKFYDIDIQEAELQNMEITLGPSTSLSERIIVDSLVEKFCPGASIKESKLKNKVRLK